MDPPPGQPRPPPPASSSPLLRRLLLAVPLLLALFFARSPHMMAPPAPSAAQPWADTPIALLTTPQYATKQTDLFTTGATHMALLHNAILRGYNSVYLQAPHVQAADKADFVGYSLAWHKFVVTHHHDEEQTLFPKVEDVLGDKTVFEETHREHQAFLDGLEAFRAYLAGLASPADFSGAELQRIMAGFQEPFATHFHSEVRLIADLGGHARAPAAGSPEAAAAQATFKAWGKSTVTKAGTTDVVPFFLLNLDGTAEDGLWENWPPMPAPIRWGLANIAGAWHAGWWKFASCAAGRPRTLYALPPEAEAEAEAEPAASS